MVTGPANQTYWQVLLGVGLFFAFVLALLFLARIIQIIYFVFFAIVLAAALRPCVLILARRLPYTLALATLYLSLLALLVLAITVLVPVVIRQVSSLIVSLPQLIQSIEPLRRTVVEWAAGFGVMANVQEEMGTVVGQLPNLLPEVMALPGVVFGSVMSIFSVVALSFYWLLARDQIINYLVSFLPQDRRGSIKEFIDYTEQRLGAYVGGLLVVSLVIGAITFIGLSLLGVRFALLLGIFAGALEVIPIMGPIIAIIPIALVATSQSVVLGLATLVFFVIVQQLEGYVIAPLVQGRVVKLNPFVILLAVLIGISIAGITGALLAIPAVLAVAAAIDRFREPK